MQTDSWSQSQRFTLLPGYIGSSELKSRVLFSIGYVYDGPAYTLHLDLSAHLIYLPENLPPFIILFRD
jgi:hypothetical protein